MQFEAEAEARQWKRGGKKGGPCPHLGLREDPDTSFAFPAPANHCYRAQPPTAVQPGHQEKYCLAEGYTACPIYREQEKVAMPHPGPWLDEDGARPANGRWRRALRVAAPAIVLLLIAGLLLLLRPSFGAPAAGEGGDGPDLRQRAGGDDEGSLPLVLEEVATATRTATAAAGGMVEGTATATPRPSPTGTPSATAEPPTATHEPPTPQPSATSGPATPTPCSRPAGWVSYVVSRGETLFQIGLRYGLSVSELQAANCLDSTSIDAGQVIYVPYRAPVPQPSPTGESGAEASPTGAPPTATAEPGEEEPPQPEPTEAPTEPPPTATPAPPTATPPIPGE